MYKKKILLAVIVSVLSILSAMAVFEYKKLRNKKPTLKEKASKIIDKTKKKGNKILRSIEMKPRKEKEK